jgi:EmrB/QacA subfamily drug resistance transporter
MRGGRKAHDRRLAALRPPTLRRSRDWVNPRLTLSVLLLAAFTYAMSQTMVTPAVPLIQRELDTTTSAVAWVVIGFFVTASIATPVVGRAGDMFGKERTVVVVLGVFGVGTLVCALSQSIEMLIAGRVIQGVSGAIFPLGVGIVRDEFPPERVAAGIGLLASTFGIGATGGLLLSGVIVDQLSYEWLFWLTLPGILVALVAARRFIPESRVSSHGQLDWLGAWLLSLALMSLLLAISFESAWGPGDVRFIGLLTLSAVGALGWAHWELRASQPLIDPRLMVRRAVWTTNLTAFLLSFGMFSTFILIPQLVQLPKEVGFGASVTDAALYLLPLTILVLLGAPLAGAVGTRLGARTPLRAGAALATTGFATLTVAHGTPWQVMAAMSLLGAGFGLSLASMTKLIVDAVPNTHTAVATGMMQVTRTVGGAVGASVTASVIVVGVADAGGSGFTEAFGICAAAVLAGFLATFAIPARAG